MNGIKEYISRDLIKWLRSPVSVVSMLVMPAAWLIFVLSGKALTLDTKSSSGSEIDAKDLAANEITAQSTSGSNTTVNPIVLLNAKASSGSSIDYVKEPKKVIKEETSGGSVSLN